MRSKSMPKSMKKQCKIHARKSDAKNMEKRPESDPKRRSKQCRNHQNSVPELSTESDAKKVAKPGPAKCIVAPPPHVVIMFPVTGDK